MSYQNQSDSDHLSIIVGPPGPENIINSVHNFAAKHDISLDDAWTVYVKSKADLELTAVKKELKKEIKI